MKIDDLSFRVEDTYLPIMEVLAEVLQQLLYAAQLEGILEKMNMTKFSQLPRQHTCMTL